MDADQPTTTAAPPHDGTPVRLADGRDYVVPPFTFDQLRALRPLLQKLAGVDPSAFYGDDSALDELLTVVHTAIQRNYPELQKEQMYALIDFRNVKAVMRAVYDLNGFVEPPRGTGASP